MHKLTKNQLGFACESVNKPSWSLCLEISIYVNRENQHLVAAVTEQLDAEKLLGKIVPYLVTLFPLTQELDWNVTLKHCISCTGVQYYPNKIYVAKKRYWKLKSMTCSSELPWHSNVGTINPMIVNHHASKTQSSLKWANFREIVSAFNGKKQETIPFYTAIARQKCQSFLKLHSTVQHLS